MSLIDKTYLCYINTKFLEQWIKENKLLDSNFSAENEEWKKEVNYWSNFFADTEFLLMNGDVLLLKVSDDNHANFLAKTYQLEYQSVCRRVFKENKNIIIVTDRQWKKITDFSSDKLEKEKKDEKVVVLFKDKENIEKNLINWKKNNDN